MKIEISRAWTVSELQALLAGADANATVTFGKTPKKDQTGTCWCGCGGATKGKFVPGHDAKFHSLAKKVARGQEEMPESFVCDEAEADFMKWYDREIPVWEATQAAKAAVAKAKATTKPETVETEPQAVITNMECLDEECSDEEIQELLAQVTMG